MPLSMTGRVRYVRDMSAQSASLGRPVGFRDRDSIPILVVRLGFARDFLIALAVFALVIGLAAGIAFVAYA